MKKERGRKKIDGDNFYERNPENLSNFVNIFKTVKSSVIIRKRVHP